MFDYLFLISHIHVLIITLIVMAGWFYDDTSYGNTGSQQLTFSYTAKNIGKKICPFLEIGDFFLKMSIFFLKSANNSPIWERKCSFWEGGPQFREGDRFFSHYFLQCIQVRKDWKTHFWGNVCTAIVIEQNTEWHLHF